METFQGLLFVKQGRIGTRSEGPDYFLQTSHGEYLLHYQDRHLWMPDYKLEFYNRSMVEIQGTLRNKVIHVDSIQKTLDPNLKRGPIFGTPIELKVGEVVHYPEQHLALRFNNIEADSRCPTGVICVWEGEVRASLTLRVSQGQEELSEDLKLTLRHGQTEHSTKEAFGFLVTLLAVEPYPETGTTIPKESYLVTAQINKVQTPADTGA